MIAPDCGNVGVSAGRGPGERLPAALPLLLSALLSAVAGPLEAQSTPAGKHKPLPEDLLPQSEFDDPIAIDESSRALSSAPSASEEARRQAATDARQRARYGPLPPSTRVQAGEVLHSVPSVRETAHHLRAELRDGLLLCEVEIRFENLSQRGAELGYRLAVPPGSALYQLQVCNAEGCREGIEETAGRGHSAYDAAVLARGAQSPLPVAHARGLRDARGTAIWVRAAPVRKGDPLTLRLRYAAQAPLHAGQVHVALPARGMDPRVAPASIQLEAKSMHEPRIGRSEVSSEPLSIEPWEGVTLSARALASGTPQLSAWSVPCGAGRCAWLRAAGADAALAPPADWIIALDVSPSTEGEARGRLLPAIAAVLGALPPGGSVRVLAFAARARPLAPDALQPSALQLAPLGRAIDAGDLGSATRFEAAWSLIEGWLAQSPGRRPPKVLIVGDGGLTRGPARPFAAARKAGVQVSSLNMANRGSVEALVQGVRSTGGIALDAGADGDDPDALQRAVSALFARSLARSVQVGGAVVAQDLGPLRAGEQRQLWLHDARRGTQLRAGPTRARLRPAPATLAPALRALSHRAKTGGPPAPALAAVDPRDLAVAASDWPSTRAGRKSCDRRGPAQRHSGISADRDPIAPIAERVCTVKKPGAQEKPPGQLEPGAGMPSDPLLMMLRRRIMPAAVGCFRRDRAGRPIYEKRAVFRFSLAEREIVDAAVEGDITPVLRGCLLSAIDRLDVPRFAGTVHVRYPLRTESLTLPARIELSTSAAGELDALLGGDRP
ncbi:MAG: VWA domain-containing protein [Myxococcales bacterium]|nr:VWA domain-containing protein [Myxococcales bacterium]